MKRYFHAFAFCLILNAVAHPAEANIPPRAANLFMLLDIKLKEPLTGFRVYVMRIAQDVFVDPPPREENFESLATFTLMVDPSHFETSILRAVDLARKSKWEQMTHPAYPRWHFRIVGPWNETIVNLSIDDENLEILFDGQWYKVEEECIRALTVDLVRTVLETDAEPKKSSQKR